MKQSTKLVAAAAAILVASSLARADGIGTIKVEPSPAKAGQEVKITVSAEGEAPTFCGMVLHFDDGSESRNVKVDGSENKFPVVVAKTYAKPGTYSIKAEGKRITTHLGCVGEAQAKLTVEAAQAPATAAGATCPKGYARAGKPGKAGDFVCKAGKGATKPAEPLACGAGLRYFDKGATLGCGKAK